MLVWTSIIAGGLLLTIVGIYLIFLSKPPTVELEEFRKSPEERGREMLSEMADRSVMTRDQIIAAGAKIVRKEEQKLEFNVAGVRLLIFGAAMQFIGTVGQVIILACGR